MSQCECANLDWSDVIADARAKGEATPEHHPLCMAELQALAHQTVPLQGDLNRIEDKLQENAGRLGELVREQMRRLGYDSAQGVSPVENAAALAKNTREIAASLGFDPDDKDIRIIPPPLEDYSVTPEQVTEIDTGPTRGISRLVTVESICHECHTSFVAVDCKLDITSEPQTVTGKVFCKGCQQTYHLKIEGYFI
jgi:hypothetical protein